MMKNIIPVIGYKYEVTYAEMGDVILWEENAVILLGVIINLDLTYHTYLSRICGKTSKKLTATLYYIFAKVTSSKSFIRLNTTLIRSPCILNMPSLAIISVEETLKLDKKTRI